MTDPPKPLWSAAEIAALPAVHIRHPLNPASDVHLRPVGQMAGLKRLALTVARVPPGKESFIYHAHERDEEFLVILAGRGRALIDGREHEVGPGDIMGFPTPSVAHHLTNPYAEDLVYLMGGERSGLDLATFPAIGKRILYTGGEILLLDEADIRKLSLGDFCPDGVPPGAGER